LQRLPHQELELADLVAGLEQPGQVVALDVELDPQPAGGAIEREDRGRGEGQLEPGGRRGHVPATRARSSDWPRSARSRRRGTPGTETRPTPSAPCSGSGRAPCRAPPAAG